MIETGNIVIPIEILTMIFEMIPQEEQIKLRSVCKAFKWVFDDGFYMKGFRFTIKCDTYPYYSYDKEYYAELSVIKTFKTRELSFENFQNKYKLKNLTFLNPEAVKILKLKGTMRSNNFSMIMDQLTNLVELNLSGRILDSLRHFHLANLKFESLKILHINQFWHKMLEKIQIFLTENEFPKLNELEINALFNKPNDGNLFETINPKKDEYLKMEQTLFSLLKKCQKRIKKFVFRPLVYNRLWNNYNFDSIKYDANLNLENYRIECPNLRTFEFQSIMKTKFAPWLAFLDKNFENLQSFGWNGENNLKEYEAVYNLLMTKNSIFLENLKLIFIPDSLSDVDFKILKGFGVLKCLEFDFFSFGLFGVNKTFINFRLISHFCPYLETLIIGKGYIDSDSIDYLLTGKNLQVLKYVKFNSKWESGNGLSVETYKKVIEENKIEEIWLFDCVNNESFADPINREYLNSLLGQHRMNLMLNRIQRGFFNNLCLSKDKNYIDYNYIHVDLL